MTLISIKVAHIECTYYFAQLLQLHELPLAYIRRILIQLFLLLVDYSIILIHEQNR